MGRGGWSWKNSRAIATTKKGLRSNPKIKQQRESGRTSCVVQIGSEYTIINPHQPAALKRQNFASTAWGKQQTKKKRKKKNKSDYNDGTQGTREKEVTRNFDGCWPRRIRQCAGF